MSELLIEDQITLNDVYMRQAIRFMENKWTTPGTGEFEAYSDIEFMIDLLNDLQIGFDSEVEKNRSLENDK